MSKGDQSVPATDGEMVGYASWYGTKFQGRLTADGEIYNMYALTAAHRTLPFGTLVRVTNLITGKSVVVRINDRGPFVAGRIIDLSKSAADIIGMPGIAKVRLQLVGTASAADFASMQKSELAAAHLPEPDAAEAAVGTSGSTGAGGAEALGKSGNEASGLAVTVSRLNGAGQLRTDRSNVPRLVPIGATRGPKTESAPEDRAFAGAGFTPSATLAGAAAQPAVDPVEAPSHETTTARSAHGAGSQTATGSPTSVSNVERAGSSERLTVQVGAFKEAANAARLEQVLASNGFAPRSERVGLLTRVVITHVLATELTSTKSRLASLGITNVIVRSE